MAKLTENTVVTDPDGQPKSLLKGADVPAWAKDQVGDHLVEGGEDAEPTGYDAQTIPDLKAEVTRRNNDRDADAQITVNGTKKADYVAALEADDKAQADGSDDDESGGSGS